MTNKKFYTGPEMKLPDEIPTEPPTVKALRLMLVEVRAENQQLRMLAGVLYSGPNLHLQGEEILDIIETPFIDFRDDTPESIRQKIIERASKHKQPTN